MPFKRRAPLRNRRYKRYAKKMRKVTRIDHPVPKNKLVKLRYCDTFQLDPTGVDAAVRWRFRSNSIYDPDYTAAGHNPMYYNQLAALYESYEVIGSQIRVDFSPTTSLGAIVGVMLDNDHAVANTNRTHLMENPASRYKIITPNSSKPVTIKRNWSARKTFGKNYNRDDNEALFGANPVNESDFMIWCVNQQGTEDPAAINIIVTIDYVVMARERRELPQSNI